MRVYSSVTISMETGEVLDSKSYEYTGPVAECKGKVKTKYVQSPQAQQALDAYMPALQRMGAYGATGAPLWDTGQIPTWSLGYYKPPTAGLEAPSAAGLMPTSANIGAIDPSIKGAVAAPYLEAIGQVTEQFGGGSGSARAGLSGAGGEVLARSMERMTPQYIQQLWGMVQPGLSQEYAAKVAAGQQVYGATAQSNLARAAAASGLTLAQYQAQQAARAAPFQALPAIVGGSMPQAFGAGTKK
jgi:hypothetical protein